MRHAARGGELILSLVYQISRQACRLINLWVYLIHHGFNKRRENPGEFPGGLPR